MVEARERGALRSEAGIVAVRPSLTIHARRDHHQVALLRRERGVVESEAAHRLRREVLRDRVAPFEREALRDIDGPRVLHVEGDAELAGVQRVEHVAALEPVRVLR